MTDPGKWTRILAAMTLVAIALLFARRWLGLEPRSAAFDTVTGFAVFALIVCAPLLIDALVNLRRAAGLRHGNGLIASWTISIVQWEAFRAAEERRNADASRINRLFRYTPTDPAGVMIRVGTADILVDRLHQSLRPDGLSDQLRQVEWIAGAPPAIECRIRRWTGGGSPADYVRFPVAEAHREAGGRVVQHLLERIAARNAPVPALRIRRARNLSFAFAVLALLPLGWGWAHGDGGSVAIGLGILIGGLLAGTILWLRSSATRDSVRS